ELLFGAIAGQRRRLGNEADPLEASLLHGDNGGADTLVLGVDITTDMRFGHIFLGDILNSADLLDLIFELTDGPLQKIFLVDPGHTPINFAAPARAVADNSANVFRLRHRRP